MDLRLFVLVLFLYALAITNTEGGIPKCCVKVSNHFSRNLLLNVEKFYMQKNNGACEINALVLYVKTKKYCAHPKLKSILKRIQKKKSIKKP
ncbi:hypothetical protein UPYG_G00180430 [Umbra pygmaea]|uniref:Chemokine interleukin-8-like domain-containing protein n=1 Tax=Umbra pygmaea TaxID=75934 RepID=A0ABD0WQH1_UMBPY